MDPDSPEEGRATGLSSGPVVLRCQPLVCLDYFAGAGSVRTFHGKGRVHAAAPEQQRESAGQQKAAFPSRQRSFCCLIAPLIGVERVRISVSALERLPFTPRERLAFPGRLALLVDSLSTPASMLLFYSKALLI